MPVTYVGEVQPMHEIFCKESSATMRLIKLETLIITIVEIKME